MMKRYILITLIILIGGFTLKSQTVTPTTSTSIAATNPSTTGTPQEEFEKKLNDLNTVKKNIGQKKYERKIKRKNKRLDDLNKNFEKRKRGQKPLSRRINRVVKRYNRVQRKYAEIIVGTKPIVLSTSSTTSINPKHDLYPFGKRCNCGEEKLKFTPCELYACLIKFYPATKCSSDICYPNVNLCTRDNFKALAERVSKKLKNYRENAAFLEIKIEKEDVDTLNDSLKKVTNLIDCMVSDSIDLSNSILGIQNFKVGNVNVFRNFASLPDDFPTSVTQFNFGYSLPLNKLSGKFVCNYRNPRVLVWFRNLYFTGVTTPLSATLKGFNANAVVDSALGLQPFVNILDLHQYSRLNIDLNANIFTYITKNYTFYFNGHCALGRTDVRTKSDTSIKVHTLQYGSNATLRTKFNMPLNLVLTYKFFNIDPRSSVVNAALNSQFENINRISTNPKYLKTINNQFYSTFNLTFQYDLSNTNKGSDAGSTSNNGNSLTSLYLSIAYTSNKILGPNYGHDRNSYLALQLGYSRNIDSFFSGFKEALGLNEEE